MRALAAYVRFAEGLNKLVGNIVAWLTLCTVLICATVVVIRYAFSANIGVAQKLYTAIGGTIWMQELYVWTHALAFMLGAGYAFMADRHVRVDILYARASERKRALLDLISTLVFLVPWVGVLAYFSWPYVTSSWRLGESSGQVGGMPGLYVLKSALLGFCLLMALQGLAVCFRSILILAGQGHLAPRPKISGLGE